MIRLNGLELPEVVQSPMANCTDLPFRLIARELGLRFAFLEMISAETFVRDHPGTYSRMRTEDGDWPVAVQLVGCEPDVMARAADRVEQMGFPLVDLNLGCPVPKVVCKGGGSQLLREPGTAGAIFRAVVRAVKRIPVTVKMRLGYSDTTGEEAVRIARLAEEAGVAAIAVHGRTREQGYSGAANYEAIGRVKRAVSIPVIGNGDVVDGASARRLLEVSGCDGVLLGRGALGNPWVYRQIERALAGAPPEPAPGVAEKKRVLFRHMELQCRYEQRPIGPLRRIICWYFKETPGAPQFRDAINRAESVDQMRAIIDRTFP
ncbi:MAG: tRNA dihydrouridine synthase DusB [Candidatus Omnitrophica bacterium]|nr:tRNA dihydrouridine synthase DusB [Candidatus Omnitrophota bacterium]